MAIFQILSFGVVVHIIFLFSIFEIYFKSPVINGISHVNNSIPAIGKRVVLISVDGMRIDSLLDKSSNTVMDVMPYLKRVAEEKGIWGISESHVPTESRPGHVAMLAGLYEDPSAVTKGWKENPVTFDSIFNKSYCSFAWGSPDILNVFFKGLDRRCAFSYSYDNEQNFAGDTMEYDNWVLRELKSFLLTSKDNNVLFESGIFFFLHLLGQDTSGHTHKPHTEKYIQNLKNVDKIVHEVETVINGFYGDQFTSFILTADHGMTDWGSHGAGHPNETNTPIVAWGAGINKPMHTRPYNINQVDITPLLSILLGCPIPVNSVGIVPLEYLRLSEKDKAEAMLLNAKQIIEQFKTKLGQVKKQIISFFYSPFEKLTSDKLDDMMFTISNCIKDEMYEDAIEKSKVLVEIGLEGLGYYQNYYQRLLLISISSSYVLWIFYLMLEVFDLRPSSNESHNVHKLILGVSVMGTMFLIFFQNLPLSFTFYLLLPQFLLFACSKKFRKSHYFMLKKNLRTIALSVPAIVIGIEVIVASFFHRYLLCMSLIATLLWCLTKLDMKKCERTVFSLWIASGIVLSGFCLLPTVGGQPNIILIVTSNITVVVFMVLMYLNSAEREDAFMFSVRCGVQMVAAWNSAIVHVTFDKAGELSQSNQILSVGLCCFSAVLLIVGNDSVLERFDRIFTSLLIPFSLLSISYEMLFIMFLFAHLRCWIFVEREHFGRTSPTDTWKRPSLSDFRRSYLFMLYIWVAFFGLGNIASLNSFDPAWVRCFLTVFSPFLMSSLILFKTIIPFLIVSCSVRAVTVGLKLKPDRMFIIVLIYCNVMGLNFLYLIQNTGSWLEIGSSISHYVIQQVTIVFLLMLYGVAKVLLSFSLHVPWEFAKLQEGLSANKNEVNSGEPILSLPRFHTNHKLHRL